MQYTVKNDTPFQILTSAIVIGPSQTGYQLEVAADGKNFSPLFTVGANVTRQATNLSSGAYYRLNGNVGDVIVNWVRSCVTEGGGGDMSNYYTKDETDEAIQEAISGISLDGYWTSAETKTYVDEAVSGISLDGYWTSAETKTYVDEAVSGISMEDIELPIAAAVNELKGDFEVRLSQKYYTRQEVNDIAARKVEAGQVNDQIKDYVDPAIAEINDNIEDKELATSAALNELNGAIGLIDDVIPAAIVDINDRMVSSSTVKTIWRGSQTDYDAITVKDAATLYIII